MVPTKEKKRREEQGKSTPKWNSLPILHQPSPKQKEWITAHSVPISVIFFRDNCLYYGAEEDKNSGGGIRGITSCSGAE